MKSLLLAWSLLLFSFAYSQVFSLNLLDDTVLTGAANPQDPIIFHFEATNLTDSTYLVDFIRTEESIPADWETALCTEACFPPEISEGIFFLDEMATDEISFYFYPSSVGTGYASVRVVNTVDSTNAFFHTLYANALLVGVEEAEQVRSFQIDQMNKVLSIEAMRNGQLEIFGLNGQLLIQHTILPGQQSIGLSQLGPGAYVIRLDNWTQKIILY
ncbi:MAG: T9SS type A sorting domain-containing protein [Bacteroidota bacterium]